MTEDPLNEDRDAFMAAMYNSPEEAPEDEHVSAHSLNVRSSEDIATLPGNIMVPTLAYVQKLETVIRQQQKTIELFRREFARAYAAIARLRQANNAQSARMGDLSREVEQKIDRRHDF